MQKFLVEHKAQIIKIWYTLLIAWLLFFLLSIPFLKIRDWTRLGRLSGSISIVTFWLSLMPGILKRFQIAGWFLPIRTLMMLYRRQLGITMYVFALTHHWWIRFLPVLKIGGDFWSFSPFELFGIAAFILLTPVFFTANDWSVRHLGHFWRTLQSLVYIIIWLLFLHISMQGTKWQALGTLIVASLETFSLIWNKFNTPRPPAAINQPQS